MYGIHVVDVLVVLLYLAAIIYIGRRAKHSAKSEEGYFLAGRKLGKLYQIFLNFGNATEPQGAVTTASFVYDRGASGAWYSFIVIFMNPYYWFMNVWFRRVRLVTMGELFEDRLNSRMLGLFYSVFQIGVAVLLIAFGSFTAYRVTASLVTKPEAQWTPAERATVEGYFEWRQLESQSKAGTIAAEQRARLDTLRDRRARYELNSYVSVLAPSWAKWTFYIVFVSVVGAYMVLGGMTAAAFNEALQGVLIIVFSVLLIPTGLWAIGGWSELGARIEPRMFELFGSGGGQQLTLWSIVAMLIPALVQMNALSPNMNIIGSARNEFAARMGVFGLFGKRLMIILWTFAGLIAIALFSGENRLADSDTVWGVLSERLLGPGLIGLMLAGVIAGVMSNLAAKSMAISSLFVRNVYRLIWPDTSEARGVYVARWTIVVVLALGLFAATTMTNFTAVIVQVMTVNAPFGAVIMMMFFWRRLSVHAVWLTMILCVIVNIGFPLVADYIPAVSQHPSLVEPAPTAAARFWQGGVVRVDPDDPNSALRGVGRFSTENYLMSKFGLDVGRLTPTQRQNVQFFWDGLTPFILLLVFSLITPRSDESRLGFFYGKMKTPVGDTPELEAQAIEETRKNPNRFDDKKLFGRHSSWEFTKWDKMDTLGFLGCCAISGAIILLFWGLLELASA